MKKNKARKGNLVEYALIAILIGVTCGIALLEMEPDLFKGVFESSLSSTKNQNNGAFLIISPISE